MLPYDRNLKLPARALRSSQTETESMLWQRLRGKRLDGLTFNRQKPLGRFIVDFYCAAAQLVVEIDGSQHLSEEGLAQDVERDAFLESLGIAVLRFTNDEIRNNIDEVVARIARSMALPKRNPPAPFVEGGDRKRPRRPTAPTRPSFFDPPFEKGG